MFMGKIHVKANINKGFYFESPTSQLQKVLFKKTMFNLCIKSLIQNKLCYIS